jgi:signal transduction histidine kinase
MKTVCIFSFVNLLSLLSIVCYSRQYEPKDSVRLQKLLFKADSFQNINPDSSFFYADKVLEKSSDPRLSSKANQCIGHYYIQKEDFGKATQFFLEALKIEDKRKDERRIADLYTDLGYIYTLMEKFNKALIYNTKSLTIYESLNDSAGIAKALLYLGNLHLSREFCETRTKDQKTGDYKTAQMYYTRSAFLNEKTGNNLELAKCYANLGVTFNNLNQPEKAYQFISKALNYFRKINDWNGITETLFSLGKVYNRLKQYPKSIDCFLQCISESQKRNLTQGIQFVYEALAQTYDNAGDFKNARDYYVKYMIVRDSVYNSQKSKQIFELDAKYQTEKKEKEILRLTVLKDRRDMFIYLLIFVIVVLSFIYRNILNKRKISKQELDLKEQKICQLEKDRQLLATQSVLQGEETERSRMARDLHDGLGGLLSGVKLSLSSMKGNVFLSSGNVEKFDHALGLLDTSIRELRRVAHNMMPEVLVKFGLNEALSDFCNSINNQSVQIHYQFYGIEKRIDSSYEINTYRIAQELINNALKHSLSSDLMVQLIQEEHRVHLTVQDNGKGFDTGILNNPDGTGIINIKSRVESLKGRYDIFSEPGKGTEISVEFIWKN